MRKMQADEMIDVKGQTCPVPLVETRKKINKMESGKVLEIAGNHGPSKKEIADVMKDLGHGILEITEEGENWSIFLRKK